MNRKEFDFLEVIEQVKFINDGLANGESINVLCTDIGIDRKSVRNRFRKIGYEYDEIQKSYISNADVVDSNTVVVNVQDKPKLPKVTNVVQTHTPVVKSTTPVVRSNTDVVKSDKIDVMLKWFEKHQDDAKDGTNDIILDVESFTGGVKVTSVRMYIDVETRFKDFSKKYPQFKTIDIMSQALLEYMEKYKSEK